MSRRRRKSRPAGNRAAVSESGDDLKLGSSLPDPAATRAFDGAFAILVRGKANRRHVYFGLPAAERAVERAHARGDAASLVLVQLHIVGGGQ